MWCLGVPENGVYPQVSHKQVYTKFKWIIQLADWIPTIIPCMVKAPFISQWLNNSVCALFLDIIHCYLNPIDW